MTKEDFIKKNWELYYAGQKSGYEGSLFKANEHWVVTAMSEYASQEVAGREREMVELKAEVEKLKKELAHIQNLFS